MGIRFHCPNGHKLNVKAFLAGKKGVCPKCGTRVRIPTASEPGLEGSDLEEQEASSLGPRPGNGSAAGAVNSNSLAQAAAATFQNGGLATAGLATAVKAEIVEPTVPPVPTPLGTGSDPISEAPTAIWYVRPPSGGQYGPARGDIMRNWLSEGRVSSDSLVWREGWTDWRTAGQLFPSLQTVAPSPAVAAPAVTATTSTRVSVRQPKKRTSSGAAIGMIVGLALLCLALVAVLAFLFFFNVKS
jgi:hypothetical protein